MNHNTELARLKIQWNDKEFKKAIAKTIRACEKLSIILLFKKEERLQPKIDIAVYSMIGLMIVLTIAIVNI